jgi:methyl-accepting chemotaxis protein
MLSGFLVNRSVRAKITISVAVSCLVTVVVAVVGVVGMAHVDATANDLYAKALIPVTHLADVHDSELKSRLDLHRVAVATNPADRQQRLDGLKETDGELAAAEKDYKATSTQAQSATLATYDQNWNAYIAFRDQQMIPAAMRGDLTAFSKMQNDTAQPLISNAADALDALQVQETAVAHKAAASSQSTYRDGRLLILLVSLVGVALSLVLGLWVGRLITRPLRRVSAVLDAVADGDLTRSADVTSRDELGRMASALDRANARTRAVVAQVAESARTLVGVAEDSAAVNADIAARAAEASAQSGLVLRTSGDVSANVATVASSTEEMRASIAEIATNSSRAATVANEAVAAAQSTNETVTRLGVSSAEIDNVVKTITSIAEQTNLLALNATIEAARAGDAGKGFAVVAGEVKDLAQETAKATEDITRRVQAIQTDTGSAVEAIGQILTVVSEIADYQHTIAAAVEEQTASAGEISRGISDAAAGSATIADNMGGLSDAAAATNDGVTRSQAGVVELRRASTQLQGLVGQFHY